MCKLLLAVSALALAACALLPGQPGSLKARLCAVQLGLPAGTGAAIGGVGGGLVGGQGTAAAASVVGALVQADLNGLCPPATVPIATVAGTTLVPTIVGGEPALVIKNGADDALPVK